MERYGMKFVTLDERVVVEQFWAGLHWLEMRRQWLALPAEKRQGFQMSDFKSQRDKWEAIMANQSQSNPIKPKVNFWGRERGEAEVISNQLGK
jgi:hypothetical protein